MTTPISVVIATYYRNTLVRDAIDSVLDQDYDPVEIIVVDDSGEGHATPVFEEYGDEITGIVREGNGGWGAAYTTGIEATTGEYIQFLDDDDFLLEGKLAKTADLLDRNDIGVAYCGLIQDTTGRVAPHPNVTGDVLEPALRFRMFPCCTITMLTKRDLLMDVLPLAGHADDINLKIELAQRTAFDYVDECLVYRRSQESRLWRGLNKIAEMKRVVEHQRDLYDRYPVIRREVLAEIFAREGNIRIEENVWSAKAINCYLTSARYSTESKLPYGLFLAALLGRPGVNFAKHMRQRMTMSP